MRSTSVPRRDPAAGQASPARERLLLAARELFYTRGINSVGVDRVIAQAGVTRATFYRHFPSKETLVLAYLATEDESIRLLFAGAAGSLSPAAGPGALLDAVIAGVAADIEHNHTRGCPFINAAAEFPDPGGAVRQLVAAHRLWFRQTLGEIAQAAGVRDPGAVAASLVLLRDAALVGGYLDGAKGVARTFVTLATMVAQGRSS